MDTSQAAILLLTEKVSSLENSLANQQYYLNLSWTIIAVIFAVIAIVIAIIAVFGKAWVKHYLETQIPKQMENVLIEYKNLLDEASRINKEQFESLGNSITNAEMIKVELEGLKKVVRDVEDLIIEPKPLKQTDKFQKWKLCSALNNALRFRSVGDIRKPKR